MAGGVEGVFIGGSRITKRGDKEWIAWHLR